MHSDYMITVGNPGKGCVICQPGAGLSMTDKNHILKLTETILPNTECDHCGGLVGGGGGLS